LIFPDFLGQINKESKTGWKATFIILSAVAKLFFITASNYSFYGLNIVAASLK